MLNQIDLSRADLNLLVLFEAVLEKRHVGRAADTLNLTPSAVSHGLGRLRRLLNDPLFLKTPKGVVPTARALELAAPVADVLARARRVIATAEQFNPTTSTRRFIIGAPDGVSAVFLPPLLAELGRKPINGS
ncbi:LysR family transcriptional regulator, partial [Chelatococcus daeguensis]|uniref:LysR family transcriptional regulator n=1 Tax=Chelatococcus daeguensis TaxID=444444 RepID=UPI0012FAE1D7